jgi:hypothetical protein
MLRMLLTLMLLLGVATPTVASLDAPEQTETSALDVKLTFTDDYEQTVIPHGQWGFEHAPDAGISFRKVDQEIQMWFTNATEAYYLHGPTFDGLIPHRTDNGVADAVFSPYTLERSFDFNYAGPGAVIPAANGKDLLMFYHAEEHSHEFQRHHRPGSLPGRRCLLGADWSDHYEYG